jgi:hypothetical protein
MASTTGTAKRFRKNRAAAASGPGGPWSPKAPDRVSRSYQGNADPHGWTLWQKHLAKRRLRALSKLFKGRQSPLLWAWPAETQLEQAERLIDLMRRPRLADRRTSGLDKAVLCWLSRAEVAAPDVGFALECLAWSGALPSLAEHLGEQAWWQLCNRLIAIAAAESRHDDPLAGQLLHGELPAVLAYVLPELAACQSLVDVSRRTLEQSSTSVLEGEAVVHGRRLGALRPLLACWTRWRVISRELDAPIWTDGAPRRFARLVEHALRLARPDGTQVFSAPQAPPWDRRLLKTALRLAAHPKTERVARLIASGGNAAPQEGRRVPSTSFNVEAAGIAVLRSDWHKRSPQLAVNYSGPRLVTELSLGKRCLWSGPTEIDLRVDGYPLVPRQAWEAVCWESDRDVDYLELELELSEDVRIQRHLALARQAGFLLVADAVLGACPRKIEYRARLPLGDHAVFHPADETREGLIAREKRALARVLPLALPEWRAGTACGSLEWADGALRLTQSAFGRSLFAPLFIDLRPQRLAKQLTWRQLTVGQDRQVVPRDAAVGYRVQLGREQWLIYRSLDKPEVRTVIGKNLNNEFLIGRFKANGKVKALLEIEA